MLAEGLKGAIVRELIEEHPLSAAELRGKIISSGNRSCTRQAVYKALGQLLKLHFVAKAERGYQLNTDYITGLDKLVRKIKAAYFEREVSAFSIPKNSRREFTVNSLIHLDSLWNSIISEKMLEVESGRYPYVQQAPHAWFALSHLEAEIQVANLISSRCTGFYTLVNGNSPLDRWIGRFYAGGTSHYGMRKQVDPRAWNYQYSVFGPFVIESRYPVSLAERLHALFEATADLARLNLQELIALVNMPAGIKVVLRNNPTKASVLMAKVLKEFLPGSARLLASCEAPLGHPTIKP